MMEKNLKMKEEKRKKKHFLHEVASVSNHNSVARRHTTTDINSKPSKTTRTLNTIKHYLKIIISIYDDRFYSF